MTESEEIIEKLDEIKSLLKILAYSELEKIRRSVISTKNKEKVIELCTGENEMGEIARRVDISKEAVRLTIRDFENTGLVISKRSGTKIFPKRVL